MTAVEKMWKAIKEFEPDKTFKAYSLSWSELTALAESDRKLDALVESFNYGFIKGIRYQKAQERKKRKAGKA